MARLNWGMIGGGEGSQIGPAHRISAAIDSHYDMVAGALDADPVRGRDFAQRLGIAKDRAYGDWKEMLAGERMRADRVDLVTVATPNSTHYAIAKGFLEAGIHVLCEKPMTVTLDEAEDLVVTAKKSGAVCAVNYGYSGYALVRHMRAMVARGDLGKIRLIKAEFAHGFHADAVMRIIRGSGGGMIRRRREFRHSLPIAAFTRCIWQVLCRGRTRTNCRQISRVACRAVCLKTTRW